MPNARTDIHSPTNLVTEDYDYVFAYDREQGGALIGIMSTDEGRAWWTEIRTNMASIHDQGQCDHCGAYLRYVAILKHLPTGQYIEVGETCLANRFERATAEFHALRQAAQLDRQQQRIVQARAAFVAENPDLAWMDGEVDGFPEASRTNSFVQDVARKLRRYGELSERQINAVRTAVVRDAERAAAREVEAQEPTVNAPTGRVEVTGEVLSTKWQESDFGDTLKMLVKITTDDGSWKLWTTVPSALTVERGDTVHIKVTVTPSNNDPAFAYGKRPSVVR